MQPCSRREKRTALGGERRGRGRRGGGRWGGREALYCGAESSCWWEVAGLAAHAHPSVTAMARTLLGGQPVVYDGDPLRDLALPAFLDKFARRKQKVPPAALPPSSTGRARDEAPPPSAPPIFEALQVSGHRIHLAGHPP